MTRLELNEDVHIAGRREVVPQHRAEERQPPDVVTSAERGDRLPVELEPRGHVGIVAQAAVGRGAGPYGTRGRR